MDLITLPETAGQEAIALVYDRDVPLETLMTLKRELVDGGHRVRLEKRQKNMKTLLSRIEAEGFTRFAQVRANTVQASDLEIRALGED